MHGDNDYILEPENDWRSILRVTETASIHEVKISYRNLMKKHHPDLAINLDHNKREKAAELAQKINAAYADAKRELDFQ
ncbi:J domain-containing protein [Ochrobactrum tritici]|uniref:J domain-containing protein n=1 Tax=Brucella tritici TaxID=94626 RepID=A0A7X6FT99_9HYPH|nr:J domain-containing protein [Brucella tritici]NKW11378.1 J domain-containing protein [Brucella tritici]